MPTFQQELARMLWLQHENKVSPDEPCKVVLPRLEAKERMKNKGERTRLIKELGSPEAYSEWNAEFDRYYEAAGNPVIAQSIMLRLLKQLPTNSIATLAADEQSEEKESLADA